MDLSQRFETTVELNALIHTGRRIAEQCKSCINDFLSKVKEYEKTLGDGGSGSRWRDVKGKVGWVILRRGDLERFRAEINVHSSAINMLLVTASVYVFLLFIWR